LYHDFFFLNKKAGTYERSLPLSMYCRAAPKRKRSMVVRIE